MNIIMDYQSDLPMYEQVINGIKSLIIKGELKENEMLPSVRALSKELNVSTITIKRAYMELERAGITYSVTGVGTFIRIKDKEKLLNDKKEELFSEIQILIEELMEKGCTKGEILEQVNKYMEG